VIGAARVAAALRLSTVVIGAVVIGFGTSAPEMVVSGLAAAQGSLDIAVGNVIGSNVANLSLVLGTAALVTPLAVASPTMRREAPLSLAAVVLFAVLVQDGLTRGEGILLLVALAGSLGWILLRSAGEDDPELSVEVEEYLDSEHHRTPVEVWRTIGGLLGTLVAAQVLVLSATTIASELGLGEGFVGLTIVAIGTSLPELATSLQAARKDETDLILGNLLGSNLFNALAVGGLAALAGPGALTDPNLAGIGVVLMLVICGGATLAMVSGRRIVRWEGAALLIAYIAGVPLLA
jgi:cation:H+ antiporter